MTDSRESNIPYCAEAYKLLTNGEDHLVRLEYETAVSCFDKASDLYFRAQKHVHSTALKNELETLIRSSAARAASTRYFYRNVVLKRQREKMRIADMKAVHNADANEKHDTKSDASSDEQHDADATTEDRSVIRINDMFTGLHISRQLDTITQIAQSSLAQFAPAGMLSLLRPAPTTESQKSTAGGAKAESQTSAAQDGEQHRSSPHADVSEGSIEEDASDIFATVFENKRRSNSQTLGRSTYGMWYRGQPPNMTNSSSSNTSANDTESTAVGSDHEGGDRNGDVDVNRTGGVQSGKETQSGADAAPQVSIVPKSPLRGVSQRAGSMLQRATSGGADMQLFTSPGGDLSQSFVSAARQPLNGSSVHGSAINGEIAVSNRAFEQYIEFVVGEAFEDLWRKTVRIFTTAIRTSHRGKGSERRGRKSETVVGSEDDLVRALNKVGNLHYSGALDLVKTIYDKFVEHQNRVYSAAGSPSPSASAVGVANVPPLSLPSGMRSPSRMPGSPKTSLMRSSGRVSPRSTNDVATLKSTISRMAQENLEKEEELKLLRHQVKKLQVSDRKLNELISRAKEKKRSSAAASEI